jgi:cobalt-zinc-cadmium efflux system membrane fusion protein
MGLLTVLPGCSPTGHEGDTTSARSETHGADTAHDDHGPGADDHHNGGSPSLEELISASCEHGVPTYECDGCRYELSVVKLSPSLLQHGPRDSAGLVSTATVATQSVVAGLNVTGEVRLNENTTAHLSPSVAGIIEAVHVDIGAEVERGAPLFKIRSTELAESLARYQRSRTLTALSQRNYEREKSLFERKISAEQELIEAQMEWERNKADLKAASQGLLVLGLSVRELEHAQAAANGGGGLLVRAPADGTIIEKHAVVGERVEPGVSVMLLADLNSLWVWADIYEQDLLHLLEAGRREEIPVEVSVSAFPDRLFHGRIDYIGARMDEQTRTVKIRARVANPDRLLRPGMFCEIRIGTGEREDVLAIPKAALIADQGQDFVFAHWQQDYYLKRPITAGREFFEYVEIIDGLSHGETIVTEGAFMLKSDVLREKMGAGCAD